MEYKDLQFLNDAMYELNLDMGNRQDVVELSDKIDKLSKVVSQLLAISPEEFNQTIKKFDKKYFKNIQ